MTYMMKTLTAASVLALSASLVWAKLPAPSDEAKAKAAEAAAKTAWAGKVDAFKLCKAQDAVVAHYKKAALAKGAAASTCADPGPFVYTPNVPAALAAPAQAAPASVAVAKKP